MSSAPAQNFSPELSPKLVSNAPIKSAKDLGARIRAERKAQGFTQMDMAGIGNTGNRVIVDIERGKPTVQLQKVLDLMDLLGLQLVVISKGDL